MHKSARVLAIIAEVLAAIAFVALLVFILLQRTLMPVFSANEEMLTQFVFPVGPVTYGLGALLVLLLLAFVAGSQKVGIWAEILVIFLLALLPTAQNGMTTLQTMLTGQFSGSLKVAATAVVNSLCSIPLGVSHLAVVLALVACGMSIAYKKMN